MKQSINLYERLYPKLVTSNPTILLVLILLVGEVLAFGLYSGVLTAEISVLSQKKQNLQTTMERERVAFNALAQTTKEESASDVVAKRIVELDQKIQISRTLLIDVKRIVDEGGAGFSSYLKALKQSNLNGVALESISIKDMGANMRFEGQLSSAERLPEWLAALKRQEVYSGKAFNHLLAKQRESGSREVNFVLGVSGDE